MGKYSKKMSSVFRREYTRRVFFEKHFEHVSKNFFKKDAHAEHVCKEKKSQIIQKILLKKQRQSRKYENMDKGGKAFILLKLDENMGHMTNFQPVLNKTITNYKHMNYGV